MAKNDLIPVAKLWKRTSQKGTEYITGYLGVARLLIFENPEFDDQDPKSPTHMMYLAQPPETESKPDNGKPAQQPPKPPTNQQLRCPNCNGELWDNRGKIASGQFSEKSPLWACKDKTCGFASWSEDGTPPKPRSSPKESQPKVKPQMALVAEPADSNPALNTTDKLLWDATGRSRKNPNYIDPTPETNSGDEFETIPF